MYPTRVRLRFRLTTIIIIRERGLGMATNRKRLKSKPARTKAAPAGRVPFPSLSQLLNEPGASEPSTDIAVANLVCASGLPGADPLHIGHYLDWLEEAAQQVRLETERNYYKFLDSPAAFGNSQARFCMVCLVTVLQQQCDVSYSRKWRELTPDCPVPETFGIDACDLTHAWESTGIASEQLLPVLDVIAKQLNLPNHFILPDDSLSILQLAIGMEDERTQPSLMPVPHVTAAPLAALVKSLPTLRLVLLNAFRGLTIPKVADLIAAGQVDSDIAMLEGVGGVSRLIEQTASERILFGSHFPFF